MYRQPVLMTLLGLGLAISCSALVRTAAAQENIRKPNVILIIADDLGGSDLGCYGSKFHRTPELDRLAAEGVRFTQAYAACPVCSPTRAAIMTGKSPARLHLTDWLPGRGNRPDQKLNRPEIRPQLPLAEVTLAEVFKAAGYATCHVGKWHLGGEGFSPLEQGFDVNIAGDHTGTPLSYFAPFSKNGRQMRGLENAPSGEYLTPRLTTEAERFIESHREQPFFLYFPHYAVHTPIMAPSELVEQFPGETPFTGQQNNPIYAAMLLAVDQSVGRLRKKLSEMQLAENTVIVFTSDNGGLSVVEGPKTPATSNVPFREGKGWLYEGGVRVPLLIAGPGVTQPGRVSHQVACSYDILPTLCRLCGLETPAELEGADLTAALQSEATQPRELYWHYPHYSNQGGKPGGSVRAGDYKLIEFYENGRRELFDLSKDVRESRNLAEEMPDKVAELSQKLDSWRTHVGAQMMTPNPDYKPNPPAADGSIVMPAKTAQVTGSQLRYEPFPHKNTLGYWTNANDAAHFEFTVTQPGVFEATGLIGCGNGSGGSDVEFRFGDQILKLTVPETGGFQQFQPMNLGRVTFEKPGQYALTVQPVKKPGPAVMDLRQVTLKPVTKQ